MSFAGTLCNEDTVFTRSRAQIVPVLDNAYQHFLWNLELVGKLCDKLHGHLSLLDVHDGLFIARQTERDGPRAESVKSPPSQDVTLESQVTCPRSTSLKNQWLTHSCQLSHTYRLLQQPCSVCAGLATCWICLHAASEQVCRATEACSAY